MDRPASPGSRADDRNPRRSWPTGRRSSIREWWSHASRSWTYEEGGPQEECATARARPRTVRRQGRYGQHRVDRAETGVLSDPGETRDGSARSPALQRHDLRPGRAVRAAQPDRKSTRLNSSHGYISYAVFCLKKKKKNITRATTCSTITTKTLISDS